MSSSHAKVITFKAGPEILDALEGLPNRSEFIRNALMDALKDVCPLCRGAGTVSAEQQADWKTSTPRRAARRTASSAER